MGKVKEINIKNQTYYFFDDMINLENFESNLLKIDKKHSLQKYWYLLHWIHHDWKIVDCKNIHSVNPLYLIINQANGCVEEKNGNKYLIFDDSVNKTKSYSKNTQMFGMKLETKSKQ